MAAGDKSPRLALIFRMHVPSPIPTPALPLKGRESFTRRTIGAKRVNCWLGRISRQVRRISHRVRTISRRVLAISRRVLAISRRVLVISRRVLVISRRVLVISRRVLVMSRRARVINRHVLVISRRVRMISRQVRMISRQVRMISRRVRMISRRVCKVSHRGRMTSHRVRVGNLLLRRISCRVRRISSGGRSRSARGTRCKLQCCPISLWFMLLTGLGAVALRRPSGRWLGAGLSAEALAKADARGGSFRLKFSTDTAHLLSRDPLNPNRRTSLKEGTQEASPWCSVPVASAAARTAFFLVLPLRSLARSKPEERSTSGFRTASASRSAAISSR